MTNYNESKMLEREILVLTLKMHTKRIKLKKLLKRERERERLQSRAALKHTQGHSRS